MGWIERRLLIFLFSYSFITVNVFSSNLPQWILPDEDFLLPINSTNSGEGELNYYGSGEGNESSWSVMVNTEIGSGIEITLLDLIADENDGDYLIMAGGETINEDTTAIQLFTGNRKNLKPIILRIPDEQYFFIKFYIANSTDNRGFQLTYKRYGDALTTDPPPTVDPNPPNEIDTKYEVTLKGKSPNAYFDSKFQLQFKEAIKNISVIYCTAKNITFEDKPVNETVFIHEVIQCSTDWPEQSICASISHSVYVSGDEVKNTRLVRNYELTRNHLEDMWKNYGKDELSELGISVYVLPKTSKAIVWWIVAVVICIIIVVIALLLFWRIESVFRKNIRPQQTEDDLNGVELRPKTRDLRISEYQDVPKFMTDDSNETVFLQLTKNKNVPKKAPKPPPLPSVPPADSTGSDQLSPTSPGYENFTGGLRFNTNPAFVEEDEY